MKKTALLLLTLLLSLGAQAQLGKTKADVLAHWGREKVLKESPGARPGYSALLLELDSTRYLQVTFKAETAVMLSFMHTDSTISEQQYKAYLAENLGAFSPQRSCQLGAKTYLIDGRKNQMVVQNHRDEGGAYPLISLLIAADPALVKSLQSRMEGVCR
ncbi:hypothetical protein ADICEAN_01626 [Cesiribacter andamanensis AMV16]|uniref:Uncharacterized protein n=2 Tax=Cesiribacter TaxID=1133570 RepID=M7N3H2_9BACT|nr:hypothetical protein ADICEAN_01626 [Cesiribacter andamanensis AMV16]